MTTTTIAILETDQPLPSVQKRRGSYGDIFSVLLRNAGLPDSVSIKHFDVVNGTEYPDLSSISGILITGSRHSSFDNDPWILKLVDFTKQAIQANVKTVGICFGHQIVGRALGCTVKPNNDGWEVSAVPISLTDDGKRLFGDYGLGPSVNIMQMHRDIVVGVPPDTQLLASTDVCRNQGFYRPNAILTLQGHPEFTKDIIDDLVDARQAIFGPQLTQDALSRSTDKNDGDALARAMVDFFAPF